MRKRKIRRHKRHGECAGSRITGGRKEKKQLLSDRYFNFNNPYDEDYIVIH